MHVICYVHVGSSSGLGRGTAIHFASLGTRLILTGRDVNALKVCFAIEISQKRKMK